MMQQSALKNLVFKASVWNTNLDAGVNERKKLKNQQRQKSSLPDAFRRPSENDPFKRTFDDDIRRISYALQKSNAIDLGDAHVENVPKEASRDGTDRSPPQEEWQTSDEALNKAIKVWEFFCRESTCHGVKNIESRNRKYLFRVFWLLIVLTMSLGLIYNVVALIFHYYDYKTVTRTQVKIRSQSSFPSVTFCNICPYKNVLHEENNPLTKILSGAFLSDFSLNFTDAETLDVLALSSIDVQNKYSFRLEDMIRIGTYEGRSLNLQEDFEQLWTGGSCYVNQDKYFLFDDLTAGLRMYVSHYMETPRLEKDGIDLHPGKSIKVALSPIEYEFLPAPYKSYDNEFCQDIETINRKVKEDNVSNFYSYRACMENCLFKKASYNCSCYNALLFIEGLPPCTVAQELLCMGPYRERHAVNFENLTCNCPRSCSSTRYNTVVSASQFPSKVSADYITRITNESDIETVRENYLIVRVFLETMVIRQEKHEPKYTFSSVFAYLGGQMGFFLGASLITMVEVSETILGSILVFLKNKFMALGEMKKSSSNGGNDKP